MVAYQGPVGRWDIYWVDLDPAVGSEQAGERRPAIVLSNDGFNARFDVVTVIPVTKRAGKKRKVYPFEVLLPARIIGLESIALPYQVRTISKRRLLDRIGVLSDADLQAEIENRLLEHFDIAFEPQQP